MIEDTFEGWGIWSTRQIIEKGDEQTPSKQLTPEERSGVMDNTLLNPLKFRFLVWESFLLVCVFVFFVLFFFSDIGTKYWLLDDGKEQEGKIKEGPWGKKKKNTFQ